MLMPRGSTKTAGVRRRDRLRPEGAPEDRSYSRRAGDDGTPGVPPPAPGAPGVRLPTEWEEAIEEPSKSDS